MTDGFELPHGAPLGPLHGAPIPEVVLGMAGSRAPELVWRNESGGLTFRVENRFVKWNPRHTGIDLWRERKRLE